ncbi:MAG: hypothetical protein JSS66_07475 [Armatimonadetes bacterium]|nr:hypothetical protein [Armatimonadota bacterium]
MTEYVLNGGIFTAESVQLFHPEDTVFPLVQLSRFPDGSLYVHDGHHRAVSVWLGGREVLVEEEYCIRDWPSLDSYAKPNLSAQWYTPFDLLTEVRLPDTRAFKSLVEETSPEEAEALIARLKHMYATAREHWTMVELAEAIRGPAFSAVVQA